MRGRGEDVRARWGALFLLTLSLSLSGPGCGEDTDASQILDVRAPVTVENVQAFAADQKIRLTWSPNPDTDLLGYNVYRSVASDQGFELIGSTGTQQAPFFQDEGVDLNGDGIPDGLTNQITYFYKVTAFDREGREGQLALASSVSGVPGVQSGSLQDLQVTGVRAFAGDERAIVTWDLADDTGVFGYFVYREVLGAPEGFQLAALIPQGRNYYTDGGLPNGSEFAYAITPVTRELFEGRRAESRVVRTDPGDRTVPKPPGHDVVTGELSLLSVDASGVTLRWGRPTENTDGTVLLAATGSDDLVGGGFIVFRAEAPQGNYEPVGILENIGSETSFTFTDPQGSDQHFYTVRAFDRLGTLSAESRRLAAGATVVPDVIREVDAFASASFSTISLNWDLDPTSLSGYRVFRSTRRDRGYVAISGQLPPTQNFFQDGVAFLETGKTFFYKVAGLAQLGTGEIIEGSLSDPAPAVAGPTDGVFYLEAEDANVIGGVGGNFDAVARRGAPAPFSGNGVLFIDPSAIAIPDANITILTLQWNVDLDADGGPSGPKNYDVLLRVIRNDRSGIFTATLQQPPPGTGALTRRVGFDFFTNDAGFPARVESIPMGRLSIIDQDNFGGNPTTETIQLTLGYAGFNPGVVGGNGELFVDGVVLVRR